MIIVKDKPPLSKNEISFPTKLMKSKQTQEKYSVKDIQHWRSTNTNGFKPWEIILAKPSSPLLSPVKSFICFQSLIIFLITVFVRGRNFRVWNKSQIFLLKTKFVTDKPDHSPIWRMQNADKKTGKNSPKESKIGRNTNFLECLISQWKYAWWLVGYQRLR